MAEEKFEEALKKLEAIVSKLEDSRLSLEESLTSFEEGVRLSKLCNRLLEKAEKKVEVLTKGSDGALNKTPFEPEGEKEENKDDEQA